MEGTKEDQPIVFGIFKDDKLIGYRADSFGTLSLEYPKIYTYSEKQVDIVLNNVKAETNHAGSKFLKHLLGMNTIAMSITGQSVDMSSVAGRVLKQEDELRDLGEFELRVIPFQVDREEFYSLGEGEEWKKKQILDNLPPAIEIYKLKVIQNEN